MKALRRFEAIHNNPSDIIGLKPDHPAVIDGQSLFHKSRVVDPEDSPRLFVSGINSRKLGSKVVKGPWAGMPIFGLTLEERATCPRTCPTWAECYGNSMNWARRHRNTDSLMPMINEELTQLDDKHGQYVIRLHILGDFFSTAYVHWWKTMLCLHPGLHIFGFTARGWDTDIGSLVERLNQEYPNRWVIRYSDPMAAEGQVRRSTVVRSKADAIGRGAIICPAQTGATDCCGTCGLCWSRATKDRPIAFLLHGMKRSRGPRKAPQTAVNGQEAANG